MRNRFFMRQILILFSIFYSFSLFSQSKELNKATKFFNAGKYVNAIKALNKGLEKDTGNYAMLFNRGICNLELEEYDESLVDFKRCYSKSPKDEVASMYIGLIYAEKKMFKEAIKFLNISLDNGFEPNFQFYYDLGTCNLFIGAKEEARMYLDKAFAMDSTQTRIYNNLAWVYIDYDPQKSCRFFTKAYAMDTADYANVNNLGYSHLLCGNLEVAFNLFQKSEALNPKNSFVYRNYGLYYMYKENKELACLNLQKARDMKIVENYGETFIVELVEYCTQE